MILTGQVCSNYNGQLRMENKKMQEIDDKIAELQQMKSELQQMHGIFSEKLTTLKGEMHDE